MQVYTGESKGKTTAALGLAFRAMGRGLKTYIGQFVKGRDTGELHAAAMVCPYITIEQYGNGAFLRHAQPPSAEDVQRALEGLAKARQAMLTGGYDLIIFDEINTANHLQLIPTAAMLEIIKAKPAGVEIVFTGRNAPQEVIAAADLVTEMLSVKHYYQQGVPARDGIEH